MGKTEKAPRDVIRGEKIRRIREKLGMTQTQLKDALGYKGTTNSIISQIERGECGMAEDKMVATAGLAGIPAHMMFDDEIPPIWFQCILDIAALSKEQPEAVNRAEMISEFVRVVRSGKFELKK